MNDSGILKSQTFNSDTFASELVIQYHNKHHTTMNSTCHHYQQCLCIQLVQPIWKHSQIYQRNNVPSNGDDWQHLIPIDACSMQLNIISIRISTNIKHWEEHFTQKKRKYCEKNSGYPLDCGLYAVIFTRI